MNSTQSVCSRFDDMYSLSLCSVNSANGQIREASFEKSVANFFDTEGNLLNDLLEPEVLKLHSNIISGKKDK